MQRIAIYPGTFDPITNGHLDIVFRASRLFDKTILAVAYHNEKDTLFNIQERVKLCKEATAMIDNVEVRQFKGLVVDFAKNVNSIVIVKGLRAVSDFEYELQLLLMNRKLYDKVETVFLTPRNCYLYLSSSIIKQVAKLGGDVSEYVPKSVKKALEEKYKNLDSDI